MQVAEEKVSAATTWKQTFTIDRYGNRRFDAANTTTLGSCAEAVCNPSVSTSNNRISSSGYSFDANGNVTQDAEGKQFFYDAENHQIEVKDSENNVLGEYLYDGQGKRVKKISNTETTIFVYNASGTLVAEYSTQISQTPQVSYLTADHLGSPRVITNENGLVTSRKDFTAFGEENTTAERETELGYTGTSETRKGYTGYEKDNESGLDFAQARYYNASHGRYTSIDPLTASASIKNPQTFNRYSYVLNSPYKFVDPLGLISESTGACGSRCPGSGPTIDGSEIRGRDATWDWAREYYGSVEGYALNQPDGSTVVENIASNFAYIFAPGSAPGAVVNIAGGQILASQGSHGNQQSDDETQELYHRQSLEAFSTRLWTNEWVDSAFGVGSITLSGIKILTPVEGMVSGIQTGVNNLFNSVYEMSVNGKITQQLVAQRLVEFATSVGIFGGASNSFKGKTKHGSNVTRNYGRDELVRFGNEFGKRIASAAHEMGTRHRVQRIELRNRLIQKGRTFTE